MRHPSTQAVYAYWNEVRGSRRAPRRLEIEPARISDFLLDTFILERSGPADFRFRLAGTRLSNSLGLQLRARDFLTFWGGGDRALLGHHLEGIADLGRVGLFTGEAELSVPNPAFPAAPAPFELIVLPLIHTGQAIDRLLCHLVVLEPHRLLAGTTIARLRLLAAETVWPESGVSDLDALAERQAPLGPHVRTARIVRQGHRQFRVYDGGLGAAQGE
ncbi:PAS domain-containing protein [Hyphomicrobium sp. CS1GBMeth3]|uniref:PAS domain-containing protein n=1 Tax=Hyphomicrobium sp. CS1GBMeth3 TaxID=1892845 RepID=UPI00093049AE|nr:PAS domain-containing protein [Hyphomicrobium sp. CS1GBMeth3]